jgi:DNA-binding transcriptional regulator YdaS (Cro superfamily)
VSGSDVSRQILARAAAEVGGVEALASRLGVSPRVVEHYISGHELVPDGLLLQVIDVVLDGRPPQSDA